MMMVHSTLKTLRVKKTSHRMIQRLSQRLTQQKALRLKGHQRMAAMELSHWRSVTECTEDAAACVAYNEQGSACPYTVKSALSC